MMHIYAGDLLMTTGSYDDAIKAFSNAYEMNKSPQALCQRARVLLELLIVSHCFIRIRGRF